MIPTSYKLRKYEDIPLLSDEQVTKMIQNTTKLVFYDQIVVDIQGLNHPGGDIILKPFVNNSKLNIKESFIKYQHSDYAQFILSLKTIGKIKQQNSLSYSSQDQNQQGKKIFQKVGRQKKFHLHQKTLQKIDFSKPIFDQLNQLSVEQKEILIQIPTCLQESQKTKFKKSIFQQFMYTNNFWLSTFCFQFVIYFTIAYSLLNYTDEVNFIRLTPYFLFGLVKWTLIEYYFHRFKLHYDLQEKPIIGDHLMHHAFPHFKNKLALSINKVATYMVAFWLIYSLILSKDQTIAVLLGVLVGLTLYDISHYYFHFGPEINISWIQNLKRNHLKHHYRDSNKGFGVSNTFWDKIFKTQYNQ